MPTPAAPVQPHVTGPLLDPTAVAQTCIVLSELAASDRALNPSRSHVSATLAALVATTARHHQRLPADVTDRVMDVVHAVDAATGRHR
jgi:hypothetical protein